MLTNGKDCMDFARGIRLVTRKASGLASWGIPFIVLWLPGFFQLGRSKQVISREFRPLINYGQTLATVNGDIWGLAEQSLVLRRVSCF